VEGKLTICYQ